MTSEEIDLIYINYKGKYIFDEWDVGDIAVIKGIRYEILSILPCEESHRYQFVLKQIKRQQKLIKPDERPWYKKL